MHIPGSMNPMQTAQPQLFYAMIEEKQAGTFSQQELTRLIEWRFSIFMHNLNIRNWH